MRRSPFRRPALVAGLLTAGAAGSASAQAPKVEDLLARKPLQAGVTVTTPAGADLAACRLEPLAYPKPAAGPAPSGYVVKDAQGRLVRQFIDTAGTGKPNLVYFFHNGAEAYREISADGRMMFRWLGVNGSKWGSDTDGDAVVDVWHVLSPEELSQELFAAVAARDPKRLAALLPTDAELKSLGLPEAEVVKIRQRAAGAPKRLADAAQALALAPAARWVHVELNAPQSTPAESFGGTPNLDLVKHTNATVLFEKGDGKTADVMQTGEFIQIGRVWKLIDGPAAGPASAAPSTPGGIPLPDAARELLAKLEAIPKPTNPAEFGEYHLKRAAILEQIAAMVKGEDQAPWLRQVIDAYTAAAEAGPASNGALARLQALAAAAQKGAPGGPVAAYAAFRLIAADYTTRMTGATPEKAGEIQKAWREQLDAFIKAHPAAEDAPEAMMRLAVAHEFSGGKDGDAQAKAAYEALAKAFPADPRAAKAAGAVKRLASEGQSLQLPTAMTLDGKPFEVGQLAGKPALVYYWANWSRDPGAEARVLDDLKKLADLAKAFADKGLTVVTVSLDDDPARAAQALNAAQLPGVHLHAAGGLDRSPLAVAYGVQMVPHLFVVGKDGKVANRNAQTGPALKEELEKLTK